MREFPQSLAPLAAYRQFIVYKLVPKADRPGKTDKFPINAVTGIKCSPHDPAEWMDAETAMRAAAAWNAAVVPPCIGYGVGFSLTTADPFWFVDVDNALEPDGAWYPVGQQLLQVFNGAAIEISQSGTGFHIIGTGKAPTHRCKSPIDKHLELYTSERFVALTGLSAQGNAGLDFSAALPWLVETYFPAREGADDETGDKEWTKEPVADWSGPEDDDELIARMMNARGAAAIFKGKATFADLFTRNVEVLSRSYPDRFNNPPRPYDSSDADAAIAQHLAFWTGNNCERIARIMRRSALYRPKWDSHKSYLKLTVTNGVSMQQRVYQQPAKKNDVPTGLPMVSVEVAAPPTFSQNNDIQYAQGLQFMAITQQVEYFKGCVYIQDQHRIFTPGGIILKPDQFKAFYAGYVFALDSVNSKTTKNPWEVFTESQAIRFPKVQGSTFEPELKPGEIVKREGRMLVNVYVPVETDRAKGDISKFLAHLHKVLPTENDRAILLAYMAACVQHKGIKFQWAPLLQGAEGNGKTLFTRCVAYAVGMRYTHIPKADDIDNKFNGWYLNKIFIGVEDVYTPNNKREVIETLKPMITNDYLEIQLKGVDQLTVRVCANFMLNSNHKDAIRKTRNDRRFAVFYTAQQSAEDIDRDGMSGDYFVDLYEWLRGDKRYAGQTPGYAMVNEFLSTYAIPSHLNPAGSCHRAPKTSSTEEVLALSQGAVEQEIAEAISEGRPGFAGGWVSSMAVDKLLDHLRLSRAIPINRRRELLVNMGYDWHPGLPDGRVNNPIPLDGGKPRLFIHNDHPLKSLIERPDIVRAYIDAQSMAAPASMPKAVQVFGMNPPTNGH